MIKYTMLMISYEFEKFMKIMICILDEMPLVFKNLNMAHFDYSLFLVCDETPFLLRVNNIV